MNSPQRSPGAPRSEMFWVVVMMLICAGGLFLFAWIFRVPAPMGDAYPIEGREHIQIGAAHDPYHSNPPTSGPHYEKPADFGIYDRELPDEQLVHNLEHGGIWISYANLSAGEIKQLSSLAKSYPQTVIMTPRAKNESRIALASWGMLLKLEKIDEKVIQNFIRGNKNHSPEPIVP